MTGERQRLGERRPKYDRVYGQLRSEIERGALRPGDHLPAERALAEQLGVSRVTIRKALAQLGQDGLLQGRRVAAIGEPANALLSFTAIAAERGLAASATVLRAGVRGASIDEAERLGIAPGGAIFELHRVRLLGGVPIAVDESHVPHDRVPGIERVDFTTASLYDALDFFHITPTRADYAIEAVGATPEQASVLDVEAGAPLLCATETVFDQDSRPIDIGRMLYRGDRYRFRTVLLRSGVSRR
jgi:GntR family transcriptional regulator